MQFRYVKTHVGQRVDDKGQDHRGRTIQVPCLLRDGTTKESLFRGAIDVNECDKYQRVKLVGFTSYSPDDGQTWVELETHSYLVGVRVWDEHYIVLYDGLPKAFTYEPKGPTRYYNNIVPFPVNKP
ncbi:hypothetical protein J5N62_02260 [Vibrio sp. CC007]|nr:hypothetical protein [Vibrio sp. CC007]